MEHASNVESYIKKLHNELDSDIASAVKGCESPIEELFAIGIDYEDKRNPFGLIFDWEPQCEVKANGKTYRVDFLVTAHDFTFTDDGYPGEEVSAELVVECDGHAYHSTKEQIKHDNQRDRDLIAEGYAVFHFSGSEINKDPKRCAYEVVSALNRELDRKMKEAIERVN